MVIVPAVSGHTRTHLMFAAVYGKFAVHRWRQMEPVSSDAVSLFTNRASAMGWSKSTQTDDSCALFWDMNDADSLEGSGEVAWFQVGPRKPRSDRPLPFQAFFACIHDVLARIGTLQLDAVQAISPVPALDPGGHTPHSSLLTDSAWYDDCDPQSSTRVVITLQRSGTPKLPTTAPGMLQWLTRWRQAVFLNPEIAASSDNHPLIRERTRAHVLMPRAPEDLHDPHPPQDKVTFVGTLAEWSLDALGWLNAYLSEACVRHGVDDQILITIRRAQGD